MRDYPIKHLPRLQVDRSVKSDARWPARAIAVYYLESQEPMLAAPWASLAIADELEETRER